MHQKQPTPFRVSAVFIVGDLSRLSFGLIFALCAKITTFSAKQLFATSHKPPLLKKTVQSPAVAEVGLSHHGKGLSRQVFYLLLAHESCLWYIKNKSNESRGG